MANLQLPGEVQGEPRAHEAGVSGPLVTPPGVAWCNTAFLLVSFLEVLNGSQEMPYTNPRGPVHIITGSAVSREGKGALGFFPLLFVECQTCTSLGATSFILLSLLERRYS